MKYVIKKNMVGTLCIMLTGSVFMASHALATTKVASPPLQDNQIQITIDNETPVIAKVRSILNPNPKVKWI